jgi:hypothetical protein
MSCSRNLKLLFVGGDQLTRGRLEEAKLLRALATSPKRRFDDLQPFVVELWHVQQDFLEVHDCNKLRLMLIWLTSSYLFV